MFRRALVLMCTAGALGLAPQPAHAQQTLNFTLGYFAVRGEDARDTTDVLVNDRRYLTFDVGDFNSATVGGEWLVPIGQFIEGGAGISFSRRTVPSFYTNESRVGGGSIDQDLKLRTVPIAFTLRVVPLGQRSPVQPYIGGGVVLIPWRYSETGDFVDFAPGANLEIFHDSDTYIGSGTATGGVALGGIRFAGDHAVGGFEVRYQRAKADLPADRFGTDPNPNPTIDLGGWTYQFTAGVRFGR